MNDLLQQIEAAISETERIALAANPSPWRWRIPNAAHLDQDTVFGDGEPRGFDKLRHVCNVELAWEREANATHIIHNDPARVLRRVARDRKLLARHYEIYRDIGWMEDGDERMEELPVCGHCVPKHSWFQTRSDVPLYPCADVRDLAEDYEIEVES